jgi:hypothetical protein
VSSRVESGGNMVEPSSTGGDAIEALNLLLPGKKGCDHPVERRAFLTLIRRQLNASVS